MKLCGRASGRVAAAANTRARTGNRPSAATEVVQARLLRYKLGAKSAGEVEGLQRASPGQGVSETLDRRSKSGGGKNMQKGHAAAAAGGVTIVSRLVIRLVHVQSVSECPEGAGRMKKTDKNRGKNMVRGGQRQDNGARSSCRAAVGDGKASGAHTTSQRAAVQHQRNRETQSVSPAGTAPELRCVAIDGVVAAGPEAHRHAHSY